MICRSSASAFVVAALLAKPGLAQTDAPATPAEPEDSAASTTAADAPTATATLLDAAGTQVGTATLRQTKAGVLVNLELTGAPAGPHGFHFHETGACEPPFQSAGGHYNPTNAAHGFLAENGPHVGDMPNVIVGESGSESVEVLSPFVSLDRESGNTVYDEDGTALVLHAAADDHVTDPSGNSGDRIACGVVE